LDDDASAQIVVREARDADHEVIRALHREAGWAVGEVDGYVLVSEVDCEVVAAVHLHHFPHREFLVTAMVVRADRRGAGIGAELMCSAMASTPGTWWLECRHERVAFYRRLGFDVVDESAVPPDIRSVIGAHPSRSQFFMRREDR
jgi:N-acetylglutamate synthase-like GNAT family acetyltransferase